MRSHLFTEFDLVLSLTAFARSVEDLEHISLHCGRPAWEEQLRRFAGESVRIFYWYGGYRPKVLTLCTGDYVVGSARAHI